jgi:decaprenylphospho-beta-D-erythro-pentofuranosid-2-ulose 2-reductase
MNGGNQVIVGATSAIAKSLALVLARSGGRLVLAARDQQELAIIAADMRLRAGCDVIELPLDVTAHDTHAKFLADCIAVLGTIDGVVICQGSSVDQSRAEDDWSAAAEMIDVNFTGAVSLTNIFARYLAGRGSGYICGVSSVAGDRGRQSNYMYGATKAAFSTYLAGLRQRLFKQGVAVITVKPGFVDTSMTWGKINPSSPLVASPERIARDIARAIRKRKSVIYTPWFWAIIMLIIRLIPEPIFKRLKL